MPIRNTSRLFCNDVKTSSAGSVLPLLFWPCALSRDSKNIKGKPDAIVIFDLSRSSVATHAFRRLDYFHLRYSCCVAGTQPSNHSSHCSHSGRVCGKTSASSCTSSRQDAYVRHDISIHTVRLQYLQDIPFL
ncbi:hypothetical protein CPB85DRAFT_160110 [Mucidula mucida]|nr:hypothetical protein CPB85DRAFT_160110 [Mucidula mucida]